MAVVFSFALHSRCFLLNCWLTFLFLSRVNDAFVQRGNDASAGCEKREFIRANIGYFATFAVNDGKCVTEYTCTGSPPADPPHRHGSIVTCSSLHHVDIVLLWCRPNNSSPFRPQPGKSISCIFCAALLLTAGDIELNPGPTDNIRFGCLNICSALKKAASIHNLIADFSLDILALSETRIQQNTHKAIKNDIAPEGFAVCHVHRKIGAKHAAGGGLAIIHRDSITVKPHPLAGTVSPSSFELQLVRITSTKPSFTVVNVYRPPSLSVVDFYDEFPDVLAAIGASTIDRLLVCGDLNCPGPDAVSVSADLADVFDVLGLEQHICSPTRANPDHLLDVLATDSALAVSDVLVDDAGCISDHRLVAATVAASFSRHREPVLLEYRRIRNIDPADFESRLRSSSLFSAPATTAEAFSQQLRDVVVATLDQVAPIKKHSRRPSKAITKWLSADALEAKRLRRRLEERWRKTRLETDRVDYRRACRRANKLINASRRDFFQEQLASATDARQRWRIAKQLLHSTDTVHNRTADELNSLCTLFSNYFVDKISTLKRAVAGGLASLPIIPNFPDAICPSLKFNSIRSVTYVEVLNLISSMQSKTSSVDYIPTSLIKACPTVFSDLIVTLANLSFHDGIFPTMFKTAAVTPLIKKAGLDEDSPANYRPISNLNNISKILERLFLSRFQPHVTSSPNFNDMQSAYRPHHSTETALIYTLDSIYRTADNSQSTLLVALDLSAAFDTIDHPVLLSRLSTSFGVSGTALSWLKSYLSNRYQTVRMGQSSSPEVLLTTGVPQGSVLGPILFSVYISPVGQIASCHGLRHQQYADDTQLYIALSPVNFHDPIAKLEKCLLTLHHWFSQNGLCLNPTKSDAVLFGTHQRLQSFDSVTEINIAGSTVKLSDKITTLGVTLDEKLTFNSHIAAVCKNAYFHMRALRHIRPVLTREMATSIAVAIVQSRLDYANSILYGISSHNIAKLQRVQNMAARVVLRQGHLSETEALSQLHWLPIEKRINFKIASLTYQTLSTGQPTYLRSMLTFDEPVRELRSSEKHFLSKPRTNLVIGERAFSHAAPTIWNDIDLSIRSAPSIHAFKRRLKSVYFVSKPKSKSR